MSIQANISQSGMIIQGNNVTITKAVLEGTPVTGITPLRIQSIKAFASETDGAIYNLSGQRVSSPSKGIYIQNGKKIILK